MASFGALLVSTSTVLSIVCYIPQIFHLMRVKDSTGISYVSTLITITALACYVGYCIIIRDFLLMGSMILQMIPACIMLRQTFKYRPRK